MSKPKRISELQIEVNPKISDLIALASDGKSKKTTLGSVFNSEFPTTLGNTTISGDLIVTGTETIISSSILYESGSTIFGNSTDDTHDFIGDVSITGSLGISGSVDILGDLTLNGSTITSGIDGTNGSAGTSGIDGTNGSAGTSGLTIDTGSFATTGSNTFVGNQTITGSVDITGDYTLNGNSFSSSLFQSSSISGSVIEFTKGDKATQQVQIPPGLGYSGLGWARYDDTTYTTSSPLTITDGSDGVLPCNGSGSIETHMHSTVSFYTGSNQKLQAENEGDVYTLTIDFSMKAVTNPSFGDYVRIQMNNTTGTPYTRVGRDLYFAKNDNSWHKFHEIFQYYADADFVLNGNEINLIPSGFNAQVADVIIFIQRTQNHSQH